MAAENNATAASFNPGIPIVKEVLGAAAAIAAAVATILVSSRKAAKVASKCVVAPARWFIEQSQSAAQIKIILKELTTNGGASLKDAVLKIGTKVEQINNKIAEAGQRTKALLEDHPDGVFETDKHGNYVWANRTLCRFLGRQLNEILGRGWELCLDDTERSQTMQEWERCIEVGREFNRRIHCRMPDGTHIFFNCHSYKISSHTGETMGYTGYMRWIDAPEDAKRDVCKIPD